MMYAGQPPPYRRSDKSQAAAIMLCLFAGGLGVHRFYLGRNGDGTAMLTMFIVGVFTSLILIGFIPLLIVGVWALVDLIKLCCNTLTDSDGLKLS